MVNLKSLQAAATYQLKSGKYNYKKKKFHDLDFDLNNKGVIIILERLPK